MNDGITAKNIDETLKTAKNIHMIGIGGAGMCPLAEILAKRGYSLSGSDNNESETLDRVRAMGIPVAMGQKAENIDPARMDMIVYTAALLPDNPELVAAEASGVPTYTRAELFGAITRKYKECVGVCGTHGKTTTTAMIVHILLESGLDPSAVIGGRLPLTGTNGVVGSSDTIICEACEFKNTFLSLSPTCSVLLNVDDDHLEFFGSMENLRAAFRKFCEMSRTVIYNIDDENTRLALDGIQGKTLLPFGESENAVYRISDIEKNKAFASFCITENGVKRRVSLKIPGLHFVWDAAAAYAAARYCGASPEQCVAAIGTFEGAGRRFETLYNKNGIRVVDDYAHHPTEIRVTLEAAMEMGFERVWAVIQPFTYSRTKMLFDDFVEVMKIPDRVILTQIMGSREVNTVGVYSSQLAEKVPGAEVFDTFEEIADHLYKNVRPGDMVITLSCGDVYKIAKLLIKKLDEQERSGQP